MTRSDEGVFFQMLENSQASIRVVSTRHSRGRTMIGETDDLGQALNLSRDDRCLVLPAIASNAIGRFASFGQR